MLVDEWEGGWMRGEGDVPLEAALPALEAPELAPDAAELAPDAPDRSVSIGSRLSCGVTRGKTGGTYQTKHQQQLHQMRRRHRW